MNDRSDETQRPALIDALTDDVIRDVMRRADSLSMGVPRGCVRINREQLLAREGISEDRAALVDDWVVRAGGSVRSLRRPQSRGLRARWRIATSQQPTVDVWELPASGL
jgi:hypothetical protein